MRNPYGHLQNVFYAEGPGRAKAWGGVGMSVQGAARRPLWLKQELGRKGREASLVWHCEDLDLDSEMREQWKVLDREMVSSDFPVNRLPLTAVLKTTCREARLKAGRQARRQLWLFAQGDITWALVLAMKVRNSLQLCWWIGWIQDAFMFFVPKLEEFNDHFWKREDY